MIKIDLFTLKAALMAVFLGGIFAVSAVSSWRRRGKNGTIFSFKKRKILEASTSTDDSAVCGKSSFYEELVRDSASDGTEVIVVGAGVAGSALAYALAKDGRRVRVFERDLSEPNRMVGEVLLPAGYLKLRELGLEDCVNEIDAHRVIGYTIYKDGKASKVAYPLEKLQSDVAGKSFHNGRFVQRLREKAASHPNVNLEEGTVVSLLQEKGVVRGVRYKTKAGHQSTAFAPLTVVCDGCFSNLRRSLSNPKVNVHSWFVGLILENCQVPFENYGRIILADPSIIVFYPISSTEVRCTIDVSAQNAPSIGNGEMAHYLKTVVAPQVPSELFSAFISAVDKGNIRSMPTRSMTAEPDRTPGALILGDALNMRHPLTGGGMTVALTDVAVLRELLKSVGDLSDSSKLCKYLESFYTLRKPMASTINILADALYKVFSASPDKPVQEMKMVILDYLSLGGVFSYGLAALLSGLNPRPLSLILNLFAVVMFGVGRLLLPFPSPKLIWLGARLILGASAVILPILKAEGVRQMFFPITVPAYFRARLAKTAK